MSITGKQLGWCRHFPEFSILWSGRLCEKHWFTSWACCLNWRPLVNQLWPIYPVPAIWRCRNSGCWNLQCQTLSLHLRQGLRINNSLNWKHYSNLCSFHSRKKCLKYAFIYYLLAQMASACGCFLLDPVVLQEAGQHHVVRGAGGNARRPSHA